MSDIAELTDELVRKGQLMEAGWLSLRLAVIPKSASEVQLREMRMAFFAGAQHLFASIMQILDPGADPTDADLARMESIRIELEQFAEAFALRHQPTRGTA